MSYWQEFEELLDKLAEVPGDEFPSKYYCIVMNKCQEVLIEKGRW